MNEFIPNQKQLEAIESKNNTIVIAGAGSGKTQTYIHKLIKNLETSNIDKNLVLTFSEKASEEIKTRLIEEKIDAVGFIGTFHSVFYKLLNSFTFMGNEHRDQIGRIYEEYKYNNYLENDFNNVLFKSTEFKMKVINIKKIDKFINENLEVALGSDTYNDYVLTLNEIFINEFNYNENDNLIEEFLYQKRKDRVLNFDDIIIETYFFIKENDYVRNNIKNYFKNIMVDEFQDTNMIVLDIIAMLENNNVFMVGDSLQSIYSFQGSDYEHINDMIENSSNLIQLDTNYRSNKNIVDIANKFIDTSITVKSNKIKAIKESGLVKNRDIEVIENITDYTIPELIFNSEYDLKDICILSRNNRHLEEIRDILDKKNIPYDMTDYNETDMILNTILLMIEKRYEPTHEYYDRFNIQNWKDIINNNSINYIDSYITIIKTIWHNENIDNYLKHRSKIDIAEKVNIWVDRIMKSYNNNVSTLLNAIDARLNIYLNKKSYITKSGVQISTIHKSKGLEWEAVILYNQEDNIFPKDILNEEEARLFYVAITRPKEKLYITSKSEINTYTKRLLDNDYINLINYKRAEEKVLNFDIEEEDLVNFDFINKDAQTRFYDLDIEKYKKWNDKKVINKYVKDTNELIQKEQIKNINTYDIEDIEEMLIGIREFQNENNIDFKDLQDMLQSIDTDKNLFFNDNTINYNYINNDFTKIIHEIINYRNKMTLQELKEEPKENNQFIRKFGKVVKKFISKKYTDITKDKAKKSLEVQQRVLSNKKNLSSLKTVDDTFKYIRKEYIKSSNTQKKFYNENIIGMYDSLNNRSMNDFESGNNEKKLEETLIDFEKVGNKFQYTKETLGAKFLNDKNRLQAMNSWSKVKYIEYKSKGLKGAFLTFTNEGKYHKWKMTKEAIRDKSLRVYGDENILEENPNFEMLGDNIIEHIKITAKMLKAIYTNFYSRLKNKIYEYEKQQGYKKKHFKLRQFKQDEPHKNLMLHEHSLIYLHSEVYHFIEETFNEVIAEHNLNPEFQDFVDFEKKEDTARGRIIIEKDDLEDQVKIFEFENEEIIELVNLKQRLKSYIAYSNSLFLLNDTNIDTQEEIKKKIQEIKQSDIYKEYKKIKVELFKVEKALRKIDKPQEIERNEIMDRLANANNNEDKNEIQIELNNFEKKFFRERASVSSYVAKYLMKGAFSDEEEEENLEEVIMFNSWKNMLGNEIRITNITNYDHTTQKHLNKMYLWYQEFAPEKLEYLKSLNKPLYVSLEELEVDGSFRFEYERKVKENFKRADYMKDIEAKYTELKKLFPKTDIEELYEEANNMILLENNDYTNIHTDKKLIGFYVKEDFIRENTLSEDELLVKYTELIRTSHKHNWYEPEEEVEIELENRYSNLVELDGISYKLIYTEDMYVKSTITYEELLSYYYGDIEKAKERYKNYYNHKDKLDIELRADYNIKNEELKLLIF